MEGTGFERAPAPASAQEEETLVRGRGCHPGSSENRNALQGRLVASWVTGLARSASAIEARLGGGRSWGEEGQEGQEGQEGGGAAAGIVIVSRPMRQGREIYIYTRTPLEARAPAYGIGQRWPREREREIVVARHNSHHMVSASGGDGIGSVQLGAPPPRRKIKSGAAAAQCVGTSRSVGVCHKK